MIGPPQLTPEMQGRIADVAEWLVKVGGSLALMWGFLARVAKPYVEWRKRKLVESIREAVQPELTVMTSLKADHQAIVKKLDVSLARQSELFDEIELFITVIADHHDRLEEVRELLDEAGFASRDRRDPPDRERDRRRAADLALEELQGRLRRRRRQDHEVENFHYRDT